MFLYIHFYRIPYKEQTTMSIPVLYFVYDVHTKGFELLCTRFLEVTFQIVYRYKDTLLNQPYGDLFGAIL